MAVFSGEDLACFRGDRLVFRDIGFSVTAGDVLVLVGANGSGKSSLLRLMAGLARPIEGRILWDGSDIFETPEDHRSRLHYVGHLDAIKPALTVTEHLHFFAQVVSGGDARDTRIAKALEIFGLARLADLPARFLSAGQKRRLTLARLLAAPAPLWLLDEPRTALDDEAAVTLDRIIAAHRTAGGMAVMAIHGGEHPPGAQLLELSAAPPW